MPTVPQNDPRVLAEVEVEVLTPVLEELVSLHDSQDQSTIVTRKVVPSRCSTAHEALHGRRGIVEPHRRGLC